MKLFKIALVNVLFSWVVKVCNLDSRQERVTRINWSNWISTNPILQPPCRENLGCRQTVAEKSICSVLFYRTLKSCLSPTSTGHLSGEKHCDPVDPSAPQHWSENPLCLSCLSEYISNTMLLLIAGPWFCNRHVLRPLWWCLTRFVTNLQQTVLASDTDQSALYHFISIPLFAHYCLRVNLYIQSLWKFF